MYNPRRYHVFLCIAIAIYNQYFFQLFANVFGMLTESRNQFNSIFHALRTQGQLYISII